MTTFVLDITKGKTRAQLCKDYLRLNRAVGDYQNIILCLLSAGGAAHVDNLPERYREMVRNLIAAYADDDDDTTT
jgi:hypothetical protein